MPVMKQNTTLTIAIADPTNVSTINDIKFFAGFHVEPMIASEMAIARAIERYYGGPHEAAHLRKVIEEFGAVEETSLHVLEEDDKRRCRHPGSGCQTAARRQHRQPSDSGRG